MKVCVVTFPLQEAGFTPLSNLLELFSKIADEVYLISGGIVLRMIRPYANLHVLNVPHKIGLNVFSRIKNSFFAQLKILTRVIMVVRKVDFFFFFMGGEGLIIPIVALKFLRKKGHVNACRSYS